MHAGIGSFLSNTATRFPELSCTMISQGAFSMLPVGFHHIPCPGKNPGEERIMFNNSSVFGFPATFILIKMGYRLHFTRYSAILRNVEMP